MKKWIYTALAVLALYQIYLRNPQLGEHVQDFLPVASESRFQGVSEEVSGEQQLADAFNRQLSDVQVSGSGQVIKVLADDTKGSRHQKFILKLTSGQTLLVAHNIDIAPRIEGLQAGDKVKFYGEYEWNKLGGVLHWTHRDPAARHVGGWLEHRGRRYQ